MKRQMIDMRSKSGHKQMLRRSGNVKKYGKEITFFPKITTNGNMYISLI